MSAPFQRGDRVRVILFAGDPPEDGTVVREDGLVPTVYTRASGLIKNPYRIELVARAHYVADPAP